MLVANMPEAFRNICAEKLAQASDIRETVDGFILLYRSVADILAGKNIYNFVDSHGEHLACDKFFDDWFLYAVSEGDRYTYSLLKLREQEHDTEDGSPADGDTPGVTISFVSFDCDVLFQCLAEPTDGNLQKLNHEINRVVAHKGQHHSKALKRYFKDPKAQGAYLVADLYTKHIAACTTDGHLALPAYYKDILQKSISYKGSAKLARLPKFLESLNREAGYALCDNEKIYIQNPESPTELEAAAILATHTGNTSVYSFAAEVEYHARFLTPLAKIKIPFYGRSIYDSAIRADMTIGDKEFAGPAPFYRPDSKIVKRQYALHCDKK